jgi:molybdate transport system regulatory protein
MKNSRSVVLEPRFRLTCGRHSTFGPGKAALLAQIEQHGSIAQAARAMDMSYMRAWTLVKSMNGSFAAPLVELIRGGRQRGGATLTPAGRRVLQLYREIEVRSLRATRASGAKLARLVRG